MHDQLVPESLLQRSKKILFITHLAIGDFTYLQTFFRAFAQKYPNLTIDIWVDEVRRTRLFWRWKHLKKYALYDWLAQTPFFRKVYNETYSVSGFKRSLFQARQEQYDIVVSLVTIRHARYASYARYIAGKNFAGGMTTKTEWYELSQKRIFKKLDAQCDLSTISYEKDKKEKHITDDYAYWFRAFFGLKLAPERYAPFIVIPRTWMLYAKLRFLKWKIDKRTNKFSKVIFINAFAKTEKRCWPLEKVFDLIRMLKKNDSYGDMSFVINVVPEEAAAVMQAYKKNAMPGIFFASADLNFFQLPAIMSICDLIISVETSVIHLASTVHVPVIALMRAKNPEWAPWDRKNSHLVVCKQRNDWVKDIPVDDVILALQQFAPEFCASQISKEIEHQEVI